MNFKSLLKDSFPLGLLGGTASLFVFLMFIGFFRRIIAAYLNDPSIFGSPRTELLAVTLNIVLFRFLVLRFNREKTGKGVHFITVMITFAYLFFNSDLRIA
jgi:hypothetical protein